MSKSITAMKGHLPEDVRVRKALGGTRPAGGRGEKPLRPHPAPHTGGTTTSPPRPGWLPEDAVWHENDYPHSAGWLVARVSEELMVQPTEEKWDLLSTAWMGPTDPMSSSRPAMQKSGRPVGRHQRQGAWNCSSRRPAADIQHPLRHISGDSHWFP